MSDELEGIHVEIQEEAAWELHLRITPSEDARFSRVCLDLRIPNQRLPLYINTISQSDLLFEHAQAELNNALRRLVNDIHQRVVKPAKQRRR